MRNFFSCLFIMHVLSLSCFSYAFDDSGLPAGSDGRVAVSGLASLPTNAKPAVLQGVTIQERLGNSLDLQLSFRDDHGEQKTFAQILGGKPLLLTLNYYRCTTLCSIQLENLAKTMQTLGWSIGQDFNMATISFDPTDTTQGALQAKMRYLSMVGQPQGQWNFYTGSPENIEKLTSQIGYFYKYDKASGEFAHAAAIFFISPNGKISRYLYGITYPVNQVKFSLMEASQNKIGSPTDQILLTCFHYNPTSGKYDLLATGLLKGGAVVTVFVLGIGLFVFFRRDKIYRGVK